MSITPEKEKQLAEILGSEQAAKEAIAAMGEKSKELREQGVGFKDSSNNPAIPVIDAEARKSLEEVKTAQETLTKSLNDTISTAVKAAVEAATKPLTDALTENQKALTDLKAQWDDEHKLYAPASKSVVTQLSEQEKNEADALAAKNKEAGEKATTSVVGQIAAGFGG